MNSTGGSGAGVNRTGGSGAGAPGSNGFGDLVRPYVITAGRTVTRTTDLRLETVVEARSTTVPATATFEHRAVLELCSRPLSIAEVAAHLRVPLGVAAILVDDLVADDALVVHDTEPVDLEITALQRMIDKVRAL